MTVGDMSDFGPVSEWQPIIGFAFQISESVGVNAFSVGRRKMFGYYGDINRAQWAIIFGAPRNIGEIAAFRRDLGEIQADIVFTITPIQG